MWIISKKKLLEEYLNKRSTEKKQTKRLIRKTTADNRENTGVKTNYSNQTPHLLACAVTNNRILTTEAGHTPKQDSSEENKNKQNLKQHISRIERCL